MLCARARLLLDPADPPAGALWFTGETRSLLFRFRGGDGQELTASAFLKPEGRDRIESGDEFTCTLRFWADEEVRPLLTVGTTFVVYHGGDVGHGEILGPCEWAAAMTLDDYQAQEKIESLDRLSLNGLAWTILYRDPVTEALWKEWKPWSEMHGGGPSRLEPITRQRALLEFDVLEEDL
jgi:hypothetical protein